MTALEFAKLLHECYREDRRNFGIESNPRDKYAPTWGEMEAWYKNRYQRIAEAMMKQLPLKESTDAQPG
jgi:hypothetical protein